MRRIVSIIKRILNHGFVILGVLGLITFSQFILEESIQVAMFGTWPAQDAKDWATVLEGAEIMEGINGTLKIVTYAVGWIQPLAFVSYREYSKATEFYIKSLKQRVFGQAPALFLGREVRMRFIPARIVVEDGRTILRNGQIQIIVDSMEPIPQERLEITGQVVSTSDGIILIKSSSVLSLNQNPKTKGGDNDGTTKHQ